MSLMKEKSKTIIVSERDRPIWQIPIAALFFTLATYILVINLYKTNWTSEGIEHLIRNFETVFFLVAFGVGFSSQKRIHVDLKNSRLKPSFEIGPIKIGKWHTIKSMEYISVFKRLKKNGQYVYEVNLWFDRNKHIELYEQDSIVDAYKIGFDLSTNLNIDLLDSTVSNNYRWIDKKATLNSKEIVYLD